VVRWEGTHHRDCPRRIIHENDNRHKPSRCSHRTVRILAEGDIRGWDNRHGLNDNTRKKQNHSLVSRPNRSRSKRTLYPCQKEEESTTLSGAFLLRRHSLCRRDWITSFRSAEFREFIGKIGHSRVYFLPVEVVEPLHHEWWELPLLENLVCNSPCRLHGDGACEDAVVSDTHQIGGFLEKQCVHLGLLSKSVSYTNSTPRYAHNPQSYAPFELSTL